MTCQHQRRITRLAAMAAATIVSMAACSGGSSGSNYGGSPTSPSSPATGGGTPTVTTAITIGAAGVAPANIQVTIGQRVTVTNNSGRTVDLSSDPHPVHTDCPQVNELGALAPGQSRQTGIFAAARTCGFHDHNDPENASLRGSILIVQ